MEGTNDAAPRAQRGGGPGSETARSVLHVSNYSVYFTLPLLCARSFPASAHFSCEAHYTSGRVQRKKSHVDRSAADIPREQEIGIK